MSGWVLNEDQSFRCIVREGLHTSMKSTGVSSAPTRCAERRDAGNPLGVTCIVVLRFGDTIERDEMETAYRLVPFVLMQPYRSTYSDSDL